MYLYIPQAATLLLAHVGFPSCVGIRYLALNHFLSESLKSIDSRGRGDMEAMEAMQPMQPCLLAQIELPPPALGRPRWLCLPLLVLASHEMPPGTRHPQPPLVQHPVPGHGRSSSYWTAARHLVRKMLSKTCWARNHFSGRLGTLHSPPQLRCLHASDLILPRLPSTMSPDLLPCRCRCSTAFSSPSALQTAFPSLPPVPSCHDLSVTIR